MAILDSSQKELLLKQVQQQSLSISIYQIAKLLEKYDNLEVEDFAPPILSPKLYKRLIDLLAVPQEVEAWERLRRRPRIEEEEIKRLIEETEDYISSFKSLLLSHVNEASALLCDLQKQLDNLRHEKALRIQKEQRRRKQQEEFERYYVEVEPIEQKPGDKLTESSHDYEMLINDDNTESVNDSQGKQSSDPNTFNPTVRKRSFWNKLFSKAYEVYSSIFAPAEVKRKSHMQVQVYLHLFEETEKIKSLAQESDKNAERRDYIPLQCKLKKGDKVDVLLNIYGETLLMSDKKSVVWQGSFTKCSFDFFVPNDIDVDELSCVALLSVNGTPVGEMRFITKVVNYEPRQLNPKIVAHKYNKVFISYSHLDESKVKFLHEGLKVASINHFFDRDYLTIGDVFPQKIQDYINSADLFILCWSENASKSKYVQNERSLALKRAFPQVKPEQAAKLRIYPMSIEPRAALPDDMRNNYHFGEI